MATSCPAAPTRLRTRTSAAALRSGADRRTVMERNRSVPFLARGGAVSEKVTPLRPRVEGEREEQILDATVDLLLEVGYDRLTMDSVAARAKAGKATLYRRWCSKQRLVVDAVNRSKRAVVGPPPDTGSLRIDLVRCFSGPDAIIPAEAHRLM